jgi:hypothetical protein
MYKEGNVMEDIALVLVLFILLVIVCYNAYC